MRFILTKDYLRKKVVRGIHDGYDLYHNKIKIDKCNAIAMLDEYFSERDKSVDVLDNKIIFKDYDIGRD